MPLDLANAFRTFFRRFAAPAASGAEVILKPEIAAAASMPAATRQTVDDLLQFALRASEADGYALYELDAGANLVLRTGESISGFDPKHVPLVRGSISYRGFVVKCYPLRGEDKTIGLITFAFRRGEIFREQLVVLDRLLQIIETVYRLPSATARLASRVSSLEVELASIKISERIAGLLASPPPANSSVDTVIRHVDNVLYRRAVTSVLRQLLPDLECRLAERKLVGKAKRLIQRNRGMSEEQAYLWLRNRSRVTRRRLRDIANELIASEPSADSVPAEPNLARSAD
jgi:hypothetical protein